MHCQEHKSSDKTLVVVVANQKPDFKKKKDGKGSHI